MSKYSFWGMSVGSLIAVLPFVMSRHLFYGAVNSKLFFITGLISVLALFFAYHLISKRRVINTKKRNLLYILKGVLVLHYISAFAGVFPEMSLFSDIIRSTGVFFLTYLALFSIIISEVLKDRDWFFIKRSIVFSGGIFALLSFFGWEGLGLKGRFLTLNFELPGLTLGNTTFAGAYLVLVFVITLIEYLNSERGSSAKKMLFGIMVVLFFSPSLFNFEILLGKVAILDVFSNPALLFGEARASSATLVMFLIYFFGTQLIKRFVPKEKTKVSHIAWSSLWLVVILSSLVMLFVPGTFVQKKYIEISSAARIIVWESSLEAFKEKPILGWGPENFNQANYGHFDNRLYLEENLGEVWFDKAHNIIVDTLVSVGLAGSLAILLLVFYLGLIFHKAKKAGIIGENESTLLIAILFVHFLQLQTSFETVSTYVISAILLGYGLWLERKIVEKDTHNENQTSKSYVNSKVLAGCLVLITLTASYTFLLKEYMRQDALFETFRSSGNAEKQLSYIKKSISRDSNFEILRLSQASFLKGAFEKIASEKNNTPVNFMLPYLSVYEEGHKRYLEVMPSDYRAHMNLAYVYLLQTAFGENKIAEAKALIKESYELSPNHPLTYAMDALTRLYSGDIKGAKSKIEEGIALNRDIEFSQEIKDYILKQEKQFPEITIIKLTNL